MLSSAPCAASYSFRINGGVLELITLGGYMKPYHHTFISPSYWETVEIVDDDDIVSADD